MPRSRSRSPRRDRRRSRSRSRSRDRNRRRRSRSRSRSPRRRRRSASRENQRNTGGRYGKQDTRQQQPQFNNDEDDEELVFTKVAEPNAEDTEGKTEDEVEMQKLMGFSNFDTTKDKQVIGNDMYCANIVKKRRYRQYMNRKGGFNRPLDAIA